MVQVPVQVGTCLCVYTRYATAGTTTRARKPKVDLMKDAGLPEPVFQKEGSFAAILSRLPETTQKATQKTTQKAAKRILQVLKGNPRASRSEIAAALGKISEDGVKYQLNKLKKQGKIERVGPDKGGYWKIVEKDH